MVSQCTALSVITTATLLVSGSTCHQFDSTLPDNTVEYVCTGSTAMLLWKLALDELDEVVDIQWLFLGRSEEMVAMFAHGNFLPMASFAQRVKFMPNAGIALSGVAAADKGDYSVQVTGRNSQREYFTLRRTVHLVVTDSILSGGDLVVTQEPVAVYDDVTKDWSVQLTCGPFIYPGPSPHFDVLWTSPAGSTHSSSFYQNGFFHLSLRNPIAGGNYTCSVPSDLAGCTTQSPGGVGGGVGGASAVVVVDGLVARVTVLEALQGSLEKENVGLRKNASRVLAENVQLKDSVAGLADVQTELTQQVASFKHQLSVVEARTNSSLLAELWHRLELLEASSRLQNTSHDSHLNSLQTQLERLNHTAAECCRNSSRLVEQQSAALSHQYAVLQREYQQLQTDHVTLGQRLNASQAALSLSLSQLDTRLTQSWSSLDQHVHTLDSQLAHVTATTSTLTHKLQSLQADLTSLGTSNSSLAQQVTSLQGQLGVASRGVGDLSQRLQAVTSQVAHMDTRSTTSDVSFHVTMAQSDNATLGHEQPVVLSHVIGNHGNAYSATSGRFTAPASATYIVMATISACTKDHFAQAHLIAGTEIVGFVETFTDSHYQSGTVHAVVHLRQGQTVWLRNSGYSGCYNHEATAFSGALLSLD